MLLSNETYDRLKFLAIYVIPSIATFVGVCGCALQWDLTAIATTIISGFGACLAGCIGMSVREYERAKREQYEGAEEDA